MKIKKLGVLLCLIVLFFCLAALTTEKELTEFEIRVKKAYSSYDISFAEENVLFQLIDMVKDGIYDV